MNDLSVIKAVFLGTLQGATEFLPVSSSGHLVIAQDLLGVKIEGAGLLAFDVCLHFGTLLAVLAMFWRDILSVVMGFVHPSYLDGRTSSGGLTGQDARRLGLFLIIGTLPAIAAVFLFGDFFESLISNTFAAAYMLLVTGTFLWLTRFAKVGEGGFGRLNSWRAAVIGCAQAVAIIPGISRSGSTISAGLFLGLDRGLAARFSFLLAVPAIGGAAVLEMNELSALSGDILLAVLVGTSVSAIVGFACIKWLLGIIRRGRFSIFVYYCWAAGLATIIYKLSIAD